MGTIRNGGNGAFSGKAGSFIGSSWKGISVIKGLPKLSNKKASPKQLDQRKRFAVVLQFLSPIKDLLNIGFKNQAGNKATGVNMAIQHALANAVTGTYPDYTIDPSRILISKGSLEPPSDVALDVSTPAKMTITWFAHFNTATSFIDDLFNVLLFNSDRNLFMIYEPTALRNMGTLALDIPANFAGQNIEVYAFFQHRDLSRCSTSIYAGAVTAT